MKKYLLLLPLLCAAWTSRAQQLEGFYFGSDAQPTGWEWQCPDSLGYNKELPHAWFFGFESVDAARRVLPEASKYWMNLGGKWKFHWASNPDERPKVSTLHCLT